MHNYNKGTKYLNKHNYTKALQFFKRTEDEFKELYLNMGNAYRGINDLKSAFDCYIKANDKSVPFANGTYAPMYDLALNNLGLIEYSNGSDENAIMLYRHALTITPLYYDALWNLGSALLRRYFTSFDPEDWELGWKLYEYRFKKTSATNINDTLERWDRVSNGDRIVVLTEQGLGDKIMFGRYLPLLATKFKEVIVQCHPSLDCFYSDYKIIRNPIEAIGAVSVPICNLASIFGIVNERWLDGKFSAREFTGFNIGCVWNGSPTHANNYNRSCPSTYFTSLADLGNLYSLNPGAKVPKGIKDISSESWDITAANVLGMDIVITVDTSIVHLCGTLGIPCIMVQPLRETDFRWGRGKTSTPWYNSVVLVENNNNWNNAFTTVRALIEAGKNVQRD